MVGANAASEANEPAWLERAVSRSLNAARSRAEQGVQRFLDAAFELIDEKGITEFTIQEVVDRSKQATALVQHTLMYSWFGNRLVENPKLRLTAEETWEFCLRGLGG